MKTCPNKQCGATNLPDKAIFCPDCGSKLETRAEDTDIGLIFSLFDDLIENNKQKEEFNQIPKKLSISYCTMYPSSIKAGESSELKWQGEGVQRIEIKNTKYTTLDQPIRFKFEKSATFDVNFVGYDGSKVEKTVSIDVKAPYIFGEKGKASSNPGYQIVDIRQCKRVSGLGWNGRYEFTPGLPVGYKGFYAVFDASMRIQILVKNGKLDTIFMLSNKPNTTLKIWKGTKSISGVSLQDVGLFSGGPKVEPCIYGGVFNGSKLLKENEFDEDDFKYVMNDYLDSYEKEFVEFIGCKYTDLNDDYNGIDYYSEE